MKSLPLAGRFAIILFLIAHSISGCAAETSNTSANGEPSDAAGAVPDTIRVLIAAYFPVSGDTIDQTVTGDWGQSLAFTRTKVDSVTSDIIRSLEEGTRMHGYKNPKAPKSLIYKVMGRQEFLEPLPTFLRPDSKVPMTDYGRIFDQIDGKTWVQGQKVDEIWIWGYHGGVIDLWESNMSSPYGDISNSDRRTDDLPVFDRTYTLFHYNYQRGAAEAVENHMHQFEAILNFTDGRDSVPESEWTNLLFWGQFVGSDSTHRPLSPRRAGWSHYPPNAEKDYQWASLSPVRSDIEDWTPDGSGPFQEIECSRWHCDHLGWFVYWMQNMPGYGNTARINGHPMRNWWTFLGNYDTARRENWKLWTED